MTRRRLSTLTATLIIRSNNESKRHNAAELKPQTPLKSFTETDQHESGHSSWHPALESLIQDQPCSQRMHIKLGVLRSGVLRPSTIVDHRQQCLPIRSPIPIFLKRSFYHVELFIVIIQSRFLDIYSGPELHLWKLISLLGDLGDFLIWGGFFFYIYTFTRAGTIHQCIANGEMIQHRFWYFPNASWFLWNRFWA